MEQKKRRSWSKMTVKELSVAVNSVKSDSPKEFKLKDIRDKFRSLGVPMYCEFTTTLVNQGIIVKIGITIYSGYRWANQEPIHINRIAELMEITRRKVAAQTKESHLKRKAQEEKTSESIEETINKAIKLLIENGYKISKPVLTYEEVTIE